MKELMNNFAERPFHLNIVLISYSTSGNFSYWSYWNTLLTGDLRGFGILRAGSGHPLPSSSKNKKGKGILRAGSQNKKGKGILRACSGKEWDF